MLAVHRRLARWRSRTFALGWVWRGDIDHGDRRRRRASRRIRRTSSRGRFQIRVPLRVRRTAGARRTTAHDGRRNGGDGGHPSSGVVRPVVRSTATTSVQRGAEASQIVVYSEEEDEKDEREDGRSCVCRCSEKGRWGRPGRRLLPSARRRGLRNDVGANLGVEKLA